MTGRLSLGVLFLLAAATTASAHGVGVEAKLKGTVVHVEAYYDDDTPAAQSTVTVTAEDGRAIAEGKTDAKGAWSFPAPPAGTYRVTVNAGDGHLAKTTVRVPLPESQPAPTAVDTTVSDGPSREEFTRFPWEKVALGLGGIAVVTAAIWWWGRRRNASAPRASQP
jgi:hypothetical protein